MFKTRLNKSEVRQSNWFVAVATRAKEALAANSGDKDKTGKEKENFSGDSKEHKNNKPPCEDDVVAADCLFTMARWFEMADNDTKSAAEYYRAAAEMGLAAAQFIVGDMYFRGMLGPRNIQSAVHWFVRASRQTQTAAVGPADAWFSLGCIVNAGFDIAAYPELHGPDDFWVQAAELGHAKAQQMLANFFARNQLSSERARAALRVQVDDRHILK